MRPRIIAPDQQGERGEGKRPENLEITPRAKQQRVAHLRRRELGSIGRVGELVAEGEILVGRALVVEKVEAHGEHLNADRNGGVAGERLAQVSEEIGREHR